MLNVFIIFLSSHNICKLIRTVISLQPGGDAGGPPVSTPVSGPCWSEGGWMTVSPGQLPQQPMDGTSLHFQQQPMVSTSPIYTASQQKPMVTLVHIYTPTTTHGYISTHLYSNNNPWLH